MKSNLPLTEKILLGLLLLIIAAVLNYGHLTERLDNAVYDAHLGMWSRSVSEDIVLVTIDNRSLEQMGRWPWPRRVHAKLLDVLKDSKVVGLDIIFAESDINDPEGDQALVSAIERHGRVVLPVSPAITSTGATSNGLYELSSLPMFTWVAADEGHVDVELDSDGISRSIFLKAGVDRPERKALPLAMLELDREIEFAGERNKNPVLGLYF
jgi:CHASE2 domain-containing sensor protein